MSAHTKADYLAELLSTSPDILAATFASDARGKLSLLLGEAAILKDESRKLSAAETREMLNIIERTGREIDNMILAFLEVQVQGQNNPPGE